MSTYIKDLDTLVELIEQWGVDRNITPEGGVDAQDQISKAMEEMAEAISTLSALNKNEWHLYGANAKDSEKAFQERIELEKQFADDLGDITVCLIQAARISGVSLTECLNKSWEEIKERKGYMHNGKFIKVED